MRNETGRERERGEKKGHLLFTASLSCWNQSRHKCRSPERATMESREGQTTEVNKGEVVHSGSAQRQEAVAFPVLRT